MARYSGKIGFAEYVENEPGVWEEQIIERQYRGDITRNTTRIQTSNTASDNTIISSGNTANNIRVNNNITVIADPYANHNFQNIRYITYMNTKWRVSDIEIQYPRMILSTGGLYNEESN